MATIPPAANWNVAENPTSTILNARIRDPFNFLKSPPMGVFRKTAGQLMSNAIWTAVSWDIEDLDSDGGHSNVTNNTRYTAQTAGWYLVQTTLSWASNANGYRKARFRVNGDDEQVYSENTVRSDGGFTCDVSTQAHIFLNVNDYVEVMGRQDSGGNLSTQNENEDLRFEVRWLGILNTDTAWDLPVPKTWAPGLWSAGDANMEIRDAYRAILDPPMAVIIKPNSTSQTLFWKNGGATSNFVSWDKAEHDTHGGWDSNAPNQYVAKRTGWYHTIAQLVWTEVEFFGGGSDRSMFFVINGVLGSPKTGEHGAIFSDPAAVGVTNSYTIGGHVFLNEGDYLNVAVYSFGNLPQIQPPCRWTLRWVSS